MARLMVSAPFSAFMAESNPGEFKFDAQFKKTLKQILQKLQAHGHQVFSAHIEDLFGEEPWFVDFVSRDFRQVQECEIQVVLLPRTSSGQLFRSDGTMIEIGAAVANGKQLVFVVDENSSSGDSFFLTDLISSSTSIGWDDDVGAKLCGTIDQLEKTDLDFGARERKQTTDVGAVLRELREDRVPHKVKVAELLLTVLPGVLSPRLSHAPDALISVWKIQDQSSILDLGCGCGVLGLAALQAGASTLVALDVNQQAVANTRLNLKRLGFGERGDARVSDVYSSLKVGEEFDLIIFAAPYWNRRASNDLEKSCYDEDYGFFTRAVEEAHHWLTSQGRMYIIFSDQGDLGVASRSIERSKLSVKEIFLFRPTSPNGHIRIVWELNQPV